MALDEETVMRDWNFAKAWLMSGLQDLTSRIRHHDLGMFWWAQLTTCFA
jgi:hypothetical protein